MAKLVITVTDPATIELLARYKTFLKAEDGASGTMTEMVEGLIVGSLDGHDRFASWRRNHGTHASQHAPAAPNNVSVLPRIENVSPAFPDVPRARRQA